MRMCRPSSVSPEAVNSLTSASSPAHPIPVYRNSVQSELKAVRANSSDWRSSAYNDLRRPVWLGSARGPFSPLWLPRPCSQKTRASVLLAPTCRHNEFPTAKAFGESLAASPRTNSLRAQIFRSCVIRWRRAPRITNQRRNKRPSFRICPG
jgi:hypothetical protein